MVAMLCDVVLFVVGRNPYRYFYACIWVCSYSYGAPLGGPPDRRSSAINILKVHKQNVAQRGTIKVIRMEV